MAFTDAWGNGPRLDARANSPRIDAHAHLPARPGARERLLSLMDSLAFARAVVVAGGSVSPETLARQIACGGGSDVDVDNASLLAACEGSGGRLIPFYFANPHRGAAAYRREGARYRGLKLGPAVHGVRLDDARHDALVEAAVELGHPVYLHCLARDGFRVDDLVALARRHPRARLILGHAGIGNCDFHAVSLIAPEPNLYFETSGGFTSVIEAAFRALGPRRVLFGTEYPLQHPCAEVEKARCLDLSPDERALFLGGNIARLLEPSRPAAEEVPFSEEASHA